VQPSVLGTGGSPRNYTEDVERDAMYPGTPTAFALTDDPQFIGFRPA